MCAGSCSRAKFCMLDGQKRFVMKAREGLRVLNSSRRLDVEETR